MTMRVWNSAVLTRLPAPDQIGMVARRAKFFGNSRRPESGLPTERLFRSDRRAVDRPRFWVSPHTKVEYACFFGAEVDPQGYPGQGSR